MEEEEEGDPLQAEGDDGEGEEGEDSMQCEGGEGGEQGKGETGGGGGAAATAGGGGGGSGVGSHQQQSTVGDPAGAVTRQQVDAALRQMQLAAALQSAMSGLSSTLPPHLQAAAGVC